MYVRSHIDTVSGDRKYIYIDENNKKYIRDKNKYYPIKKYKGSYTLQKIRGGTAVITVKLLIYGMKSAEETKSTDPLTFDASINMNDVVLDGSDKTYMDIIEDKKIHIFNKDSDSINAIIDSKVDIQINHYIIIKDTPNKFEVYLKTYESSKDTHFDINKYKTFYNIIYKRNNKIDKYSEKEPEKGKLFFVIFSINEDNNEDAKNKQDYNMIPDSNNQEYYVLYNTALDKLKYIYQ